MILAVPFLLVFIAGLAAAVYSMLQGVTAAPAAGITTRLGMITAPSVAAFAVAFGAIGYLCTTRTALSSTMVVLLGFAGGAATVPLTVPLLARVAKGRMPQGKEDPEMEGRPARVLATTTDTVAGEIAYLWGGQEFRHAALNVVAGTLGPGKDVVIDRIENDIAYIEDWDRVEERL